jgi:hypothetical protein
MGLDEPIYGTSSNRANETNGTAMNEIMGNDKGIEQKNRL